MYRLSLEVYTKQRLEVCGGQRLEVYAKQRLEVYNKQRVVQYRDGVCGDLKMDSLRDLYMGFLRAPTSALRRTWCCVYDGALDHFSASYPKGDLHDQHQTAHMNLLNQITEYLVPLLIGAFQCWTNPSNG